MTERQCLEEMVCLLGGEVSADLSLSDLERIWRGLINQCQSADLPVGYLDVEDTYLKGRQSRIYDLTDCQATSYPQVLTFTGDMTSLALDVVVNAANSDLLGCFLPNHACLDNAIHTFAGARLRQHCQQIMAEQGHKEPIAQVKLTPAYHLPAQFIYHTVGPFIPEGKAVSPIRQGLLKQSYLACLQMAEQEEVTTIAFPCLATGQFGFPKDLAARIAVETVTDYLTKQASNLTVIFCPYDQENQAIYQKLLGQE